MDRYSLIGLKILTSNYLEVSYHIFKYIIRDNTTKNAFVKPPGSNSLNPPPPSNTHLSLLLNPRRRHNNLLRLPRQFPPGADIAYTQCSRSAAGGAGTTTIPDIHPCRGEFKSATSSMRACRNIYGLRMSVISALPTGIMTEPGILMDGEKFAGWRAESELIARMALTPVRRVLF